MPAYFFYGYLMWLGRPRTRLNIYKRGSRVCFLGGTLVNQGCPYIPSMRVMSNECCTQLRTDHTAMRNCVSLDFEIIIVLPVLRISEQQPLCANCFYRISFTRLARYDYLIRQAIVRVISSRSGKDGKKRGKLEFASNSTKQVRCFFI